MPARTQRKKPTIDPNARRVVRSLLRKALEPQLTGDALKQYLELLEKAIFRIWHHSQNEYVANSRRLVYSLQQNSELALNYEPGTLAALNDETLGAGSAMHLRRQQHQERRREYAKLIEQDLDLEFDTGDDANHCPYCKSKRVITISIQKRAADEGYSNYGECQESNCRKRFAINS